MARTASIGIRIEQSVKDALDATAKADRRTTAAYVEMLIIKDLEEKGALPKGLAK